MPGRQIYPQLHHFKHATRYCKVAAMKFFVNQAGRRSHPLDVTWSNAAPATGTVTMLHLAAIDNCYRLEPTMRMCTHTVAFRCRRELMGPA